MPGREYQSCDRHRIGTGVRWGDYYLGLVVGTKATCIISMDITLKYKQALQVISIDILRDS